MAAGESRYNPISYHNGTVWPHDNALIALGLSRYGYKREALRIFSGMFDAMQHFDLFRPPELFCGFSRRQGSAPTQYPVACSPQAWASAMPYAVMEACLGLSFHPQQREIRLDRAQLPQRIDALEIRGLELCEARVELVLRRYEGGVGVELRKREGDVNVIIAK